MTHDGISAIMTGLCVMLLCVFGDEEDSLGCCNRDKITVKLRCMKLTRSKRYTIFMIHPSDKFTFAGKYIVLYARQLDGLSWPTWHTYIV
jgi:hypothetical protein